MKNESKDFSIIDKELTVDGTVSTKGRLIIKGVVKGTLVLPRKGLSTLMPRSAPLPSEEFLREKSGR